MADTPTLACAERLLALLVFENREHDFPQRVLYWMEGERLHARIEGKLDGREMSEEWAWSRGAR